MCCGLLIGLLESAFLVLLGGAIRARMFVPDEYYLLITSFIIVGGINLVAHLTKCGDTSSGLIGFTVMKLVVVGAECYYALVMMYVIETDKWYYEYFQLVLCGENYIDGKIQRLILGDNPCAKRVLALGCVFITFFIFGLAAVLAALKKVCSSKEKAPAYLVVTEHAENRNLV